MKKWFILLLFLGMTFLADAQEYIITKSGEKIDCKIQKVDSANVYFTYRWNGNTVNTMIARADIKEYGSLSQYHADSVFNMNTGKISLRFCLFGGAGYLISSSPKILFTEQPDYINKMRLGLSYGGEISIFPKDIIGIGLKYLVFHSNNSSSSLLVEDNLITTFLGLSLSMKKASAWKRANFIFGCSLGSLKNSNIGNKLGTTMYVDGSTLGFTASAGLDVKVRSNIAIGVDLSVLGGNISKYNINGSSEKLASPDNIIRTDLTGGMRFYF
jgi:hypothetical protein